MGNTLMKMMKLMILLLRCRARMPREEEVVLSKLVTLLEWVPLQQSDLLGLNNNIL
jgi:hypothetical protein